MPDGPALRGLTPWPPLPDGRGGNSDANSGLFTLARSYGRRSPSGHGEGPGGEASKRIPAYPSPAFAFLPRRGEGRRGQTARILGRLSLAAALLGALALACRARPAGAHAERIVLTPGAVLPRSLDGEGPHRFRFTAEADRFLHLDVEQRGVDVTVQLEDPFGRLLYEIDSPNGKVGPETVLAVTPASGRYLLTVEAVAAGAKGDFALAVREVRPATDEDRRCAAAAAAFARGELRQEKDDFERAAAAYRQAASGVAACGDRRRRAEAEWHLGESLVETGELREAAAVLEGAVAKLRDLGDGNAEARAANKLGQAWRILGRFEPALAAYRRALGLYREAGNVQGEATTLNNIGLVYERTGDLQGAIVQYETALALWRRLGLSGYEAVTLQNLGSLYALIGHDDEALDLLRRALGLHAGEKDARQRMPALIALGWVEYLTGRPASALERYRQAMTIAERSGDRLSRSGILDRRGTALKALRRYGEAAASYEQALALCRAEGSRISEGHTLANLGWLDLETGDVARGHERLRRARELLAESGDPNGEVYALVGSSRAERRLGYFGPARQHVDAAIRLVEGMRTGLRGAASRGQFLATRYDAYEELVNLLMDQDRREPKAGHAREALEVAERARARNLVDEIAGEPSEARSGDGGRGQRAPLLAEIEAMEQRRRTLAARNPRDPRLRAVDAALRSRWLESDRLATMPAPPRPVFASVSEIQSIADADSLLVVFLLSEPSSFAWTVDRNSVIAHVLPGRELIEKLARRVVAALPHSHERATQETAARVTRELSEVVLAPLAPRLAGRRRLVILADGALHLVPFGALPAPAEGRGQPAEPLLVQHEIVMLPSATALLSQRRRLARRQPAPKTVAVLADPVFSKDDERFALVTDRPAVPVRSDEGMGLELLRRLPHTAEEARAIVGLIPRQKTLLAMGFAARRDLVTSGALRSYRILHFATHGLLDPVLPERSGLVLSLFDENGRRRQGFLSAPDVAALDLPAELAVLSACQTGLGREVRGEGLVGLTQAFFRAGVRGVVVGYWDVDDRATAALMARFYRNLFSANLPPAAALRAAQLAVREKRPSPYYWGGFAFHGDWRQAGKISADPLRRLFP
jgi:CHAT domain-containing protein/tetratricopeptide (TPR) repeat protein